MEINRHDKKKKLLTLYRFDEILEVMGYFEGKGSTAWDDDVQANLESLDNNKGVYPTEFVDIVMEHAIDNGNFEEALSKGQKLPV